MHVFLTSAHKLIIEVDGAQHLEQFEYDHIRTAFLSAAGYEVIRFWNDEVLQDLDCVLEAIHNRIIKLVKG
jgi:very-short-patch-repair endonuclease